MLPIVFNIADGVLYEVDDPMAVAMLHRMASDRKAVPLIIDIGMSGFPAAVSLVRQRHGGFFVLLRLG